MRCSIRAAENTDGLLSAVFDQEPERMNALTPDELTLGMAEQIRLILRGGSVIDWYRLRFDNLQDARNFFSVNKFDISDPYDEARVRSVYKMAREYLSNELSIEIHESLWNPEHVTDPLLVAAGEIGPLQRQACILMKIVHTINHCEARELRLSLPLSELEVFGLVEAEVKVAMDQLVNLGYPIVQFTSSRKTRASTITKLLSKRRATAADILDRLRFRVIVESVADVPCLLVELNRILLPFNYVIPEETTNDLIDFRKFFGGIKQLQAQQDELQFDLELEVADPLRPDVNECSADEFRMLNFVIDLPVRIDEIMERPENAHLVDLGKIVFVNVEFQIFDKNAWETNESNPSSSHDAYKERQQQRVRERLMHGLEPHNNARK